MKRITRNLLTISSIAISSIVSIQTNAEAITVSLDGGTPSGNVYNYSITLDNNESLDTFDTLVFLDLADVTNATASSPFQNDGFGSEDANFSVTANTNGSQTLSNVIQITSNAPVGIVNYDLFTNSGSFSNTVLGPSTTATSVPFEFSPSLGLLLMGSVFGISRYVKSRKISKLTDN